MGVQFEICVVQKLSFRIDCSLYALYRGGQDSRVHVKPAVSLHLSLQVRLKTNLRLRVRLIYKKTPVGNIVFAVGKATQRCNACE